MKLLFTLSLSLGLAVATNNPNNPNNPNSASSDTHIFCERKACEMIRPDGKFVMEAPQWNYVPEGGWPAAVEGAFPEAPAWSEPKPRSPTASPTPVPTGSPTPVDLCLLESQGEELNKYVTENDDASQACNIWIVDGWVCNGDWMSVHCAESCKGNCPAQDENQVACLADTLKDPVQSYLGAGGSGGSCLSWASETFGDGAATAPVYSCEEGAAEDWMWQNCRTTCKGKCGSLPLVNSPDYFALSTEDRADARQKEFGVPEPVNKLTKKQLKKSAAYKESSDKQKKRFRRCRKEVVDDGCVQAVKAAGCKLTNAGKCRKFIKTFL